MVVTDDHELLPDVVRLAGIDGGAVYHSGNLSSALFRIIAASAFEGCPPGTALLLKLDY